MKIVKQSKSGIDYLSCVLKDKVKTITKAMFWKISHTSGREEISLKIGRYKKEGFSQETLECSEPKSELTLEHDEFQELIKFISENYEPFKSGIKQYIPIDKKFDLKDINQLKALFENPNKKKIINFVVENNILPADLIAGLQNHERKIAITEFEEMLGRDLIEHKWQEWFIKNDWVLGSEFVRIGVHPCSWTVRLKN